MTDLQPELAEVDGSVAAGMPAINETTVQVLLAVFRSCAIALHNQTKVARMQPHDMPIQRGMQVCCSAKGGLSSHAAFRPGVDQRHKFESRRCRSYCQISWTAIPEPCQDKRIVSPGVGVNGFTPGFAASSVDTGA